jgi:hypothetical protein
MRTDVFAELITGKAAYCSCNSLSHRATIGLPGNRTVHLVQSDKPAASVTYRNTNVNAEMPSSRNGGVYDLSRTRESEHFEPPVMNGLSLANHEREHFSDFALWKLGTVRTSSKGFCLSIKCKINVVSLFYAVASRAGYPGRKFQPVVNFLGTRGSSRCFGVEDLLSRLIEFVQRSGFSASLSARTDGAALGNRARDVDVAGSGASTLHHPVPATIAGMSTRLMPMSCSSGSLMAASSS